MPSEQLQRWLSAQIALTEQQAAETPETPPGKPMSTAKAMFSGVAYGLKLAQQFDLNGLAVAVPFQSALALPCGRVIGTEAPMPDGVTVCSCGQVHPRQPRAENAAPWMVTTHA